MSTVIRKQENSQVLPFIPTRQTFEAHLQQLAAVEQKVISELPLLSEEDIRERRGKAKSIVVGTGWRIECACDYELWRRADRSG